MVYIESPSTNPAFNLALEQYVFDRMDRSQEYFMLWQNDNTVVIGKNQNAFAEVNQKVADAKHISVVRRLSGGGAVYHDLGNLNFTFILDAKDATDLDIRLFCQPIAELLRSLNVPAEVNGRNDISIEGKKFSGNSQYLKQGRIMHHGTLMFHSDLSVVADVLNVSADKFQSKAAKSVKARVTNIAPYLPEGFTLAQFKALLLKYILKEENVQPYVFSAEELAEVEKIKRERYDKWEWNYGFSPSYSVEKSRRFEGCGKIEQSYGSRCVKPPIVIGDVSRPAPITVEWAKYAQSLTDKPVKGMLTGPVTILCWSFPREDVSRETIAKQIALALRDEVADLEAAGIGIIQIDEPALREGLPLRRSDWDAYLQWGVEAFRINAAVAKDDTQIHTHMCYCEFNDIMDSIAALDADVITIETSRSDMELLESFEEFDYPNEIGPGVYDIHSPNVPSVEWIEALLKKAAKRIPAERLWVNPDCGLKTRGWPETRAALANMVQAAQNLRRG